MSGEEEGLEPKGRAGVRWVKPENSLQSLRMLLVGWGSMKKPWKEQGSAGLEGEMDRRGREHRRRYAVGRREKRAEKDRKE
jgi:hypothetical protein